MSYYPKKSHGPYDLFVKTEYPGLMVKDLWYFKDKSNKYKHWALSSFFQVIESFLVCKQNFL